jgi:hypothetical protein
MLPRRPSAFDPIGRARAIFLSTQKTARARKRPVNITDSQESEQSHAHRRGRDSRAKPELQNDFRLRALWSGLALAPMAWVVFETSQEGAPEMYDGLTGC